MNFSTEFEVAKCFNIGLDYEELNSVQSDSRGFVKYEFSHKDATIKKSENEEGFEVAAGVKAQLTAYVSGGESELDFDSEDSDIVFNATVKISLILKPVGEEILKLSEEEALSELKGNKRFYNFVEQVARAQATSTFRSILAQTSFHYIALSQ